MFKYIEQVVEGVWQPNAADKGNCYFTIFVIFNHVLTLKMLFLVKI